MILSDFMKEYDHKKIETKIQKEWEKSGIYKATSPSTKAKPATGRLGRKFYALIEFPYPSGDGLHVGHPRPYIGMDVISRKRRMEGLNVLYPIGWDAFGLPTENYAIKTGIHPAVVTKKNSDNFRRQIKMLGISFDWSREINTTDPKYYKWTQWIFLQFFKKGLAYKAKSYINWCPEDKIGLANEEASGGICERCGGKTEKREKEQWMLAITKYADRLDKDLDLVDYPERVKTQQRNWIGKSEGSEIEFKINTYPLPPSQREGEFGYHTTDYKTWRALQDRVLEMRNNPTQAENKLWQSLRKNLTGYHFRRWHIIDRFVVDFVCLAKNLVIEVDGDVHDYQKEKDKERTDILKTLGFKIIRFRNEEVLRNLGGIIKKIENELKALPFGEGLGEVIKVFTTRADTLFGATYVVLAPEHPLVEKLLGQIKNKKEVEEYIKNAKKKSEIERTAEDKAKTGVELKGIKAINPANNEEIPVFIADYVLPDYGTGAIMAVPAHDERDFAFAKKYNLPVKYVIAKYAFDESDPPRDNMPLIHRLAVNCFVKNPKNGRFLLLDWKVTKWKGPISGGVEEGENLIEAAIREIREESGYKNLKFIKYLGNPIRADFFHPHKNENRAAEFHGLYFELVSEDKDNIDPKELSKHEPRWLSEEETRNFITEGKTFFERIKEENLHFTDYGILVNSGKFNGLSSEEAQKKITEAVGGKIVTKFKLRDWVFSRQRYWGEPIPLVNCEKCGLVPVPDKDLPIKLPEVKSYKPTDTGESPLASISKWVNIKCPKCGGKAKRETDTMPNWAGSSWYYLRYTDPKNSKEFASQKNLEYWLGNDPRHDGVNWYNGGMEHTTLHLLYSRFWHKFLYDLKLVPTLEPYQKRTSHGMILGEGGVKMSKSLGNVVNPDNIVKTYGADALRVYEMFMGPFEEAVAWSTESIIGSRRFIEKIWRIAEKIAKQQLFHGSHSNLNMVNESNIAYAEKSSASQSLKKLLHKTIKKVSEDIENMRFNTAISAMMILATEMEKAECISEEDYKKFLQILAPFAPHITENIWRDLGEKGSIHLSAWPKWDESLIKDEEIKIAVQINGKVRTEILIQTNEGEEEVKKKALANQTVLKYLAGGYPKKVIYVKNRVINILN